MVGARDNAQAAVLPCRLPCLPMLMKRSLRELTRTFVAGLLAALPLFATAAVFIWLGRLLYDWLGPNSLVGQVFVQLGIGLSGSALLGYALGALIIVLGVFALGLLVEAELQRGLARLVNGVVRRIPLVRNVYDLISRFVDMLSQREDDGLKSMSPVWCSFGGEGGVKVLGLLSTPDPIVLDGQRYRAVLVGRQGLELHLALRQAVLAQHFTQRAGRASRRAGRHPQAEPVHLLEALESLFVHRRQLRQDFRALHGRHRQRTHLAITRQRQGLRDIVKNHVNAPARQINMRRRGTAIRDMQHVHARHEFEHLAREMHRGAGPG
mgnify:CR=1 FL=1